MRTAEEILDKYLGPYSVRVPESLHEAYKKALNEARVEVIIECANELTKEHQFNPLKIHSDILKLIDQVK